MLCHSSVVAALRPPARCCSHSDPIGGIHHAASATPLGETMSAGTTSRVTRASVEAVVEHLKSSIDLIHSDEEDYVEVPAPEEQSADKGIGVRDVPDSGVASKPVLPAGINSLEEWGRTIITWGKAAYNKQYKDIQAETTTENRSYKEWVLRQKTLNSPFVKDVQDYLLACDGPVKKVYFAGTTTVRKLAPPS